MPKDPLALALESADTEIDLDSEADAGAEPDDSFQAMSDDLFDAVQDGDREAFASVLAELLGL